jgi:hypothetical protein
MACRRRSQKRGLPRSGLSDNGAAMTAAEITEGLTRLGILHQTTLPYSPYQNAKQEAFWGPVEGRLIAMLEDVPDLTLAILNEATQAWVEYEYNRKVHSEIGEAPITRFLAGPEVTRPSPDSLCWAARRRDRSRAARSSRAGGGNPRDQVRCGVSHALQLRSHSFDQASLRLFR